MIRGTGIPDGLGELPSRQREKSIFVVVCPSLTISLQDKSENRKLRCNFRPTI